MMQNKIAPMEESPRPIGVFWDIENCQVPRGKSAMALVCHIREQFFQRCLEAEFMCVCDIRKESAEVIQELNLAQLTVVHVNAVGKNAADDKLKQCMRRFVDIHGSLAVLVLISGDVNFSTMLSDFRHRKQVHIILVCRGSAPEALMACANEWHDFAQIAAAVPFRTPQSKGGSQCCDLMVRNLPLDKEPSLVHSRLRQLSDNCGGRVLSIVGESARLRFSTPDDTRRACKRMDGEDVFGRKIAVQLPESRQAWKWRGRRLDRAAAVRSSSSNSSSSRSPESSCAEADSQRSAHQGLSRGLADRLLGPLCFDPTPQHGLARPECRVDVASATPRFRSPTTSRVPGGAVLSPLRPPSLELRPSTSVWRQLHFSPPLPRVAPPPAMPAPRALLPTPHPLHQIGAVGVERKMAARTDAAFSVPSVEVEVTNLDPKVETDELEKILLALFQEHVPVLRISLAVQPDGTLKALVRVPSSRDAHHVVARLHHHRLGERCLRVAFGTPQVQSVPVAQALERPYCEVHDLRLGPSPTQGEQQWALWTAMPGPLPEVCLPLDTLATRVERLLDSHAGSLPLDSFRACHEAEFGLLPQEPDLEPWQAGKVPLEQLVASLPGIEVLTSPLGFKKAVRTGRSTPSQVTPSARLEQFSREVRELLSLQPRCSVSLHRFVPTYHKHFGRQCRLADYGHTKLLDLLCAVSHVVKILGQGHTRVLTLSQPVQLQRFAADLLQVLRAQRRGRLMAASRLPCAFQDVHQRALEVADYGACTLGDLLSRVPPSVVTVESRNGETFLCIPEKEQTAEEAELVRQFALEAVELLSQGPESGMLLAKFNPAYQQHFDRKLRVSRYGFNKLIQLLQAIPDLVEVYGVGDHKMVRLVPRRRASAGAAPPGGRSVGKSPQQCPRSSPPRKEGREEVEMSPPAREFGELRRLVSLLMEQPGGLDLGQLWDAYHSKHGGYPNLRLLKKLEQAQVVRLDRQASRVRLSALHLAARDVVAVLREAPNQAMTLPQLERAFRSRYVVALQPHQHGFASLEDLFLALPEYFVLSGPKDRRTLRLARDTDAFEKSTVNPTDPPESLLSFSAVAPPSTDPGFERELLELRLSPEDLLNGPIPSCIPSPELSPEVPPSEGIQSYGAARDLIKFDPPPDGSSVSTPASEPACEPMKLFDPVAVPTSPVTNVSTLSDNLSEAGFHPTHNSTAIFDSASLSTGDSCSPCHKGRRIAANFPIPLEL